MAKRTDANQREIVDALRGVGATVLHLHEVGRGAPDICVGFRTRNYLLEIKDGAKSPSRRRLTRPEQTFHNEWRGQVSVVHDVQQALAAIGAI